MDFKRWWDFTVQEDGTSVPPVGTVSPGGGRYAHGVVMDEGEEERAVVCKE